MMQKILTGRFASMLLLVCICYGCSNSSVDEPVAEAKISDDEFRPVTGARVIEADKEPGNWLSTGRTYDEQRFSPLASINDENIERLGLAWYFDIETERAMEGTPVVADGVMYVTSAWSEVFALNAATGELLWHYDPQVPRSWGAYGCCDVPNRGAALWSDKVYVATFDGYLVALNAKTGDVEWKADTIDRTPPYTITGAPRIVKGKVIIGNGGADYGVRGFVSAYDAESGEQLWKTFMVPGKPADGFESDMMREAAETWTGEWWTMGGGGTAWDSFAFDPELDLLYVGVGNGTPWNREVRSPGGGDNLFLASILALDPDTGEYAWHYQTTPGETWDYTATQHMILADLQIDGRARKVLMQAPKNGFFYVIDRETGEFISGEPFVPVNWASHIDPETGRPVEISGARYEENYSTIFPSSWGGHNWHPMSYSPLTGLVYIPVIGAPEVFSNNQEFVYHDRQINTGNDAHIAASVPEAELAAQPAIEVRVSAWDPVRQKEVFQIDSGNAWNAGVLTTAGNLLFQGDATGEFGAYRADNGTQLWSAFAKTGIMAAPMTYEVDGEQYVTVLGGWGVYLGMFVDNHIEDPERDAVGRVLTYKLGSDVELPAAKAIVRQLPDVAPLQVSSEELLRGRALFAERCSWCHGVAAVGTGSIPDLRYSSAATHSAWNAIVLEGAYFDRGMPTFGGVLTDEDARLVRAYVLDRTDAIKTEL